MQIACPKCGVTIEAIINSLSPLRWGTNDFPTVETQCHEWRDPANAAAKASNTCHTLDSAVIDAVEA
jgi:hypothetical protein